MLSNRWDEFIGRSLLFVEYVYDTGNAQCAAGETFALGRVTAMRANGMELKYRYDRFGQIVRGSRG